MERNRPERKKAYMKKAVEKLMPEIILPDTIPANKQAWIDQVSKKIQQGEVTIQDIGKDLKLTDTEVLFCQLYMSQEFKGDHTGAALKALELDPSLLKNRKRAYEFTRNRLLPNHPCMLLAKVLLCGLGFNEVNMDRELQFLAEQNADLRAKAMAIDQYNKLTGRLKKNVEITHVQKIDFTVFNKKQLKLLADTLRQGLITPIENDISDNQPL